MFEEHVLDPAIHDRAAFRCGVPALDEYLSRYAAQQAHRGISNIYVLVDAASPKQILGYYSLSAAQIDVVEINPAERKKLPRYPVPCFRLGRLACRLDQQGKGIGNLLIGCAIERCLLARKQVAAYALIVDAKDANAKAFYLHYGFTSCVDAAETLYLPLGR